MPHLSELHGAATHLAVVAIPVYVIVLLCRRADLGGRALAQAEPWVVGSAVAGVLAAGITGLLVKGQAETTLRGSTVRTATIHFWLGIALAAIALQGMRAPRLAGGAELARFRQVHGHGLFPARVVTDKDFEAIDAWLRTLAPPGRGD